MMNSRTIAIVLAGLIAAIALVLIINRGGLIAWTACLTGIGLLTKSWLKPSGLDLGFAVGLAFISVLAWTVTRYYVIATWESGEVVELTVETSAGPHTARLWVMDTGADPLVYYDAEPEVAASLLAGNPVQFSRGGNVSTRFPKTQPVDTLPEDEANRIFEAMNTKYGDRVGAATIYFAMLGRSRDRVAVVTSLAAE